LWNTSLSQVNTSKVKTLLKRLSEVSNGGSSFAADLRLHAILALCLLAILLTFYGFRYPLHHDLAGSALSGRLAVTLGSAFSNYSVYFPPAEKIWFSMAARLSDLTGLRLDLVVVAMSGLVMLFGASLAYRIRRSTVGASPLFFILSIAILTIVPILFKNIFGLREFIVVAGLWPYLVLRISDPDGTRISVRTRIILGLWMGTTLLLKYLYCVVVLLVELADALIKRRFKSLFQVENILAGMVVFLYLFLWLGIDPAQRAVIGAMFSAIDAALVNPADNRSMAAWNMLPAIFLLLASRTFHVSTRETALAFAVTLGAVLAAWAQERWSSHHLYPITMACIFWWWIGARKFPHWLNAIVALIVLFPVYQQYRSTTVYHQRLAALDQALELSGILVSDKRVAILNAHPSPYNQYLVSHRGIRWTPMVNNAYVTAELEYFDKPENVGKVSPPVKLDNPGRHMLHDEMLRLWEDMPPDAIIMDRTTSWPLRYIEIDWQQAFSNDPRFKKILKHYRPVLVYKSDAITFDYYTRADLK
jgi:hypothetical protein